MKKLLLTVAMLAFTSPLFATITPYIPAVSPLVLPDGTTVGDLIQFTPSPADALWHVDPANAYIASQSAPDVEVFAEGLVGENLNFLYAVDQLSGHQNETYSAFDFNVLTFHYANKELVFFYEEAITEFTIGDITQASGFDLNQDLSNVRVFATDGPDATDATAPGAMALIGMGLIGLGLARRRG